jgi:hypothetical protein
VLSYTDRRRLALRAALDLLQSPPRASELRGLQRGLDTWAGVGLVTKGAQRQGCDLQLKRRQRPSLARHVLRRWDRSLHRRRLGVGADAVARGAAGGMGGELEAGIDETGVGIDSLEARGW